MLPDPCRRPYGCADRGVLREDARARDPKRRACTTPGRAKPGLETLPTPWGGQPFGSASPSELSRQACVNDPKRRVRGTRAVPIPSSKFLLEALYVVLLDTVNSTLCSR